MRRRKMLCFCVVSLFVFLSVCIDVSQGADTRSFVDKVKGRDASSEIAGEFFGIPVPLSNYYFARRVVETFNAPWRPVPKNKKELEDLTWQELLLSYEAYRRGIKAMDVEINSYIDKILRQEKVSFNWHTDKEAFRRWVEDKLKEPVELFRNQVAHLIKLNKLREQVIDSIEPDVTEKEAYQKFLDEYNTLSVELIQFDDLKKAQSFYGQIMRSLPKGALDKLIWDDLILSYEAYKRKIKSDERIVKGTIAELLWDNNVRFNWKKNKKALKEWIKDNIGVSEDVFRKRISFISKIDKLRQDIYAGNEQPVDKNKIYDNILRKYKTIKRAYIKFPKIFRVSPSRVFIFKSLKDAEDFYRKVRREAGPWGDKKRKDPKQFRRPGFVALDFLIHMWKFKRDDAYNMLKLEPGDYYHPAPIYKGYAVFKILNIRKADPREFEKRRQYYFKRVGMIKKYEGFKQWLKDLKEEADIKIYIK